jgi:hypothetical protein
VVQGEIDVGAADVRLPVLGDQERWHPAAHNHDVVAVLGKQPDQLQHDGTSRLDL